MLELFTKHINFIAPELTDLSHTPIEKNEYLFNDPLVNKHWLSFRAVYFNAAKKGQIDALNLVKTECMFKIEGMM